jgi:hypothetical protein
MTMAANATVASRAGWVEVDTVRHLMCRTAYSQGLTIQILQVSALTESSVCLVRFAHRDRHAGRNEWTGRPQLA